jgi:hypothetical protein
MAIPFGGEKFIVKRSELGFKRQFIGDWRFASEDQIKDLTRFMILAATYMRFPKAANSKFSMARRFAFAWETPIEIVDDIWGDRPPQPVEPRELRLHGKWDKRYIHPFLLERSELPTYWQNAPTSLLVDFARTIVFAQGFERFAEETHPGISWESHQAYAYQMPVEISDDPNEWFKRKQEELAAMSKKERQIHETYSFKRLSETLKSAAKREHDEWI